MFWFCARRSLCCPASKSLEDFQSKCVDELTLGMNNVEVIIFKHGHTVSCGEVFGTKLHALVSHCLLGSYALLSLLFTSAFLTTQVCDFSFEDRVFRM